MDDPARRESTGANQETSGPILELIGITKSFGAVQALKDVSFDLKAGEVHALLGENGAGKSTLIKVITGAHAPDGGQMRLGGRTIHHFSPAVAHKLGVACIYQQPALFPDLTVAENIGLRLEPVNSWRRIHWRKRRQTCRELLDRLEAQINPEAEVGELSMPEQQLVEIACALGAGARLVIMDEPTASLTQNEQHLLFKVVRTLRQTGVGIIYISHRLEEIFALADRVTVLRDGQSVGTRRVNSGERKEHLQPATAQSDSTVLTEAELIQLMVGREVNQIYPASRSQVGEVVLAIKNLHCAAPGLHDISLEVRAGEIVGLAGLVGAGRTELAHLIFGLSRADSGQIIFNGRPVLFHSPQHAVRDGIAYLPEDRRRHGLIVELPISHNMSMAIHTRLFKGGWLRRGPEREVALVQMQELGIKAAGPEALGSSLSGGNQQKVALARWLVTKPKLLILDEPTQGVDVGAKSEIHRIIRNLTEAGLAVLMISSDLPEILGMSDRIVVMRGGTTTSTFPGKTSAAEVMAAALGHA